MSDILYKFLNGREATHVPGFRYRLRSWTPPVKGPLVPCENGYHLLREQGLSQWIARDLFVAEYDGDTLDGGNKLVVRRARIVEHLKGWNKRTAQLCAADFAEAVLPIFEKKYPNDDRPRLAIQATRGHANGLIGATARAAAWDAARDAAWNAAKDAARDAAWAATWDATRAAIWDATRDAAWDAARTAQSARIIDYAYGRAG